MLGNVTNTLLLFIYIYIYISQEKSVVTLLPIMGVTKLLLTTPEIKILFTVRFDYLWVVFISGFQQISNEIQKHSSEYQLLYNAISFCTFMFQTETILT